MSVSAVAQIEQGGRTDPHYSTLDKLAGALNMSVGELLGESPEPTPPSRTRTTSPVSSYAGHIENVALARQEQVKAQDGSFPTSWEAAMSFEDKFTKEALSLMEAAEIAAVDFETSAGEFQSLEAAYAKLWEARRALGRRVGEVLDSHMSNLKEADAGTLARKRQEREREQAQRESAFLEHQEKIRGSA
jgi:transcriptional regulator with XRE-family HTH domain